MEDKKQWFEIGNVLEKKDKSGTYMTVSKRAMDGVRELLKRLEMLPEDNDIIILNVQEPKREGKGARPAFVKKIINLPPKADK